MSKRAPTSAKRAAFVREYLVDLNATQAAIRAGYSKKTAVKQGSRLLTDADIAKAVAEGMQARAQRLDISADRVALELARIAFADPKNLYDEDGHEVAVHELPEDMRRCIASIEYTQWGRKLKLWNKPETLNTLARHLGMLTDKMQVTGKDGGPVETRSEVTHGEPDRKRISAIVDILRRVGAIPDGGGGETASRPDGAEGNEVHPAQTTPDAGSVSPAG